MSFTQFFEHHKLPSRNLTPAQQRKFWLPQFLKAFFVVFFVYASMYLIRSNFKAAQPLLKEQFHLTTTSLGWIGLAFSLTYAFGKMALGYVIDGRNTKRIISFLLVLASIMVLLFGLILSAFGSVVGMFVVLWGLNGLFQSAGGPASCNTVYRWVPRTKRATTMALWNISHNIGGGLAGIVALWGANKLFNGNVIGMFIFPASIALVIGIVGIFFGKDDPEECGLSRCEEIFEEPIEQENIAAESMSKWQIFVRYTITNPWIWMLCVANVFVYIVRIGVDNWAPLYVTESLHFTSSQAVSTLFYFEMGALIGTPIWGLVADWFKGRNALVGTIALCLVFIPLHFYAFSSSVNTINIALFFLGLLLFAPQLLIPLSIVGLVPKKGLSVANGMAGTFGYLFGDSIAKIGLAMIADPTKPGLHIGSYTLHGWVSVFSVMIASAIFAIIFLGFIIYAEERKIRALRKAA